MKKPIIALVLSILVGGFVCQGQAKAGDGEILRGAEMDGVRIRLVPFAGKLRLGKPMQFRLEMKNVSDKVVYFDSQAIGTNDSFSVKEDASGTKVPYIGGSVQTKGSERPLKVGQTIVLLESIDLAGQYMIVAPGVYRIRFRPQGPAFGKIRFAASNEVEIMVGKGKLSLSQSVTARLIKILPDERCEISFAENNIHLYFNPTGLKDDIYYISLVLEKERLEDDRGTKNELVGTLDGWFVYLSESPSGKVIDEVWKDHHETIIKAVGVQELRPRGDSIQDR